MLLVIYDQILTTQQNEGCTANPVISMIYYALIITFSVTEADNSSLGNEIVKNTIYSKP